MFAPRLAVATAPFELPLRQAISLAGELGVSGVQFEVRTEIKPDEMGETARKQFLHYLSERSLSLGTLVVPLNRPLYEREKLDLRMEKVRGGLVLASQLRVRTLIFRAGRIPDNDTPDRTRLEELLADLAMFGNHLGVVPTITPSDDSAETLLELTGKISSGPVGIDFDPAGFAINRRKPEEALHRLHGVVQHLQIRDGRSDVDGSGQETVVGQGQVRWEEILALAAEMNYQGWMTIRRTGGEDRLADCVRAVKLMKSLARLP